MNLVTQCPSCYTRFIVKPEQLDSHDGQVRCGQCQQVFSARDHLNEPSASEDFLNTVKAETGHKTPLSLALCALLILLAFAQTFYFLRGDIAKQWPVLKPALVKTCHYLGCSIPLPQHAELFAIDDIELIKDETHEDIVKFNCVIINNASYAQSFPSVELTLTDKQDMPLMRRKIAPKEYLRGLDNHQNEGLAGNEEIHVSLNLKTANLPVAGFRAFIVY